MNNKCTAADGKTQLYTVPGQPIFVRAIDFNDVLHENARQRSALEKLISYNQDAIDGKINYRPQDHIDIARKVL